MVDTVNKKGTVLEVIDVIEEHKGGDALGLYIGEHCSWTDYFVITTANSTTHLKSLHKFVRAYLKERNIEPLSRQKFIQDDTWILIDCGFFVIHMMSEETRTFYELEKLWFMGEVIYSSKSS
jgi:ribosome-associated protein